MKLITLNVSFGLVVKLIQFGKKLAEYAYLKFDKLIKLKLKDVLFGYKETENCGYVLAINHVILIAKMCISKYRYGKYFDLFLLFERELSLRNA